MDQTKSDGGLKEKTHAIVHFISENTVEIVPKNWIVGDNQCYYPPVKNGVPLLVKKSVPFNGSWGTPFPVKILKWFGKIIIKNKIFAYF